LSAFLDIGLSHQPCPERSGVSLEVTPPNCFGPHKTEDEDDDEDEHEARMNIDNFFKFAINGLTNDA
jgi:hypothetical protein